MTKKRTDDESEFQDDEFNDESFGLPDIDYKPLDPSEDYSLRDSEEAGDVDNKSQNESKSRDDWSKEYNEDNDNRGRPYTQLPEDDDDGGKSNRIWLWIIIIIILFAAFFYFGYNYIYLPKVEKEKQEEIARQKEIEERRAAELLRQKNEQNEKQAANETSPKKITSSTTGSIEFVASRTGRYFIVISSSIDEDLAMDYAKKLQKKNLNVKIIKSRTRLGFTRLTIGDYDNLSDARSVLSDAREQFGQSAWVLRY